MLITSETNSRIKYIKRLNHRRFRETEGKFIVEGVRFVEEALSSGHLPETIVYTSKLTQSRRGKKLLADITGIGIPRWEVSETLFTTLADTITPQGVLAVVNALQYDLHEIIQNNQNHLLVLVDGIQDPGNLGTIVRSADAAGATGVILAGGTVDFYNPKTLRATMGSAFHLPIIAGGKAGYVAEELLNAGMRLIVGIPQTQQPVYKVDLTGPVVLVVGSEANGVSEDVKKLATHQVSIPMPGRAESLNAAVAAAIMLYEVVRQRLG